MVIYGSKTWTLKKIDENSILVFERKVLKKIYGPCIDEPTGEWEYEKTRNFMICIKDQALKKISPKED